MYIVNKEGDVGLRPYSLDELQLLVGSYEVISGKVIRLTSDDKLIIDLGNDIYGELPIYNFEDSTKPTSKVALIDKVGKNISFLVESIENGIINLNRKKLLSWYKSTVLEEKFKPGVVLKTNVLSLANFGVFVDIGYGLVALLANEDISISRVTNIKSAFERGQELYVVYKGEKNGFYFVSHRELLGTWSENIDNIELESVVQGVIREIQDYGIFVELHPNLTGIAEVDEELDLQVGDSVSVFIKSINPDKIKVKLVIIQKTETPYKVKYNYILPIEESIKKWEYSPKGAEKIITTYY